MYYEKSKSQIYIEKNQLEMVCLDQLVPEDHFLRKVEEFVDFDFIHDLTKDLYSHTSGRHCLDTVTLFKIVFLSFLTGKNSIRATLEDAKVNMAYRWFLNIPLTGKIPNYSTFAKKIDELANDYSFNRIYSTVRCALLIGMAEIYAFSEIDVAVSVNEAVKLASKFSTDKSISFINGILAKYANERIGD